MVDYDNLGTMFGNGKFLKWRDVNPIEGEFVSITREPDPFGKKGEERLLYTFLIDGEEKALATKSVRLFRAFQKAKVKEGDRVRVEKHGLGYDTDFEVEVVKK